MSLDTIWYTRCPVPTAFGLAIRLGLVDQEFEGDGIAVRSLAESRSNDVRRSHFVHSQPASFRHGGNVPAIVARARGADTRLVALSSPRVGHHVLVASDSGIRDVSDLKGHRLSIPRRPDDGGVDFWRAVVLRGFTSALSIAGLTWDDVEPVTIEVPRSYVDDATDDRSAGASLWGASNTLGFQREELVALLRGDVDAIFSEAGMAPVLRATAGLRSILDVELSTEPRLRGNNAMPQAFTVSGRLLDEHPDIVARVLAQSIRAADHATSQRELTRQIIAQETGLPEALVDAAFTSEHAGHLGLHLDPSGLDALQGQVDFLVEHQFIDQPVDLGEFVHHEVLEDARRYVERDELSSGALWHFTPSR